MMPFRFSSKSAERAFNVGNFFDLSTLPISQFLIPDPDP
jgi:hypothetical protein